MKIKNGYFFSSYCPLQFLALKTCNHDILKISIFSSFKGALAIRRIFSLVDMISKPKFSNCPYVFKIELFR